MDPATRPPADQAVDERLAVLDHVGDLVGPEDLAPDDEAVAVEVALFIWREVMVAVD